MSSQQPLLDRFRLGQAAPAVAHSLGKLVRAHPWLEALEPVRAAIAAVALAHPGCLRALELSAIPPLGEPERRRALVFLMNMQRRGGGHAGSCFDAFVQAAAAIHRTGRSVPVEAERAARALESCLLEIVHAIRLGLAVRRVTRR